MSDKNKKNFQWEEGEVLDEENTLPLGQVRQHGLPKVKKAVASDPKVRQSEREEFVQTKQTEVYSGHKSEEHKLPGEPVIIEETHSGITNSSEQFDESEVKRLTDKGDSIRKIGNRFGPAKSEDDSGEE